MDTKSILVSILMIGVVAMAAGAGTIAYFSDTETSTGNTFTAGIIDIAVDGQNPWNKSYAVAIDGDTLLKPCQKGWINFTIANVGNNPLEVWKHIKNVVTHENGVTEPEEAYYKEHGIPLDIGKNDIDKNITYDLIVNDAVKIPQTAGLKISDIECKWIYLGAIPVGGRMNVNQSYHLQPEVDNWAQSDKMTFTMELFAQQTTPPGPVPGPELPGG